jgi:hypothetical protein
MYILYKTYKKYIFFHYNSCHLVSHHHHHHRRMTVTTRRRRRRQDPRLLIFLNSHHRLGHPMCLAAKIF